MNVARLAAAAALVTAIPTVMHAQVPVLADGLFPHSAKVDAPLETDVTLPNISCKRCTLQVIQFMEQHGPNNPGMYTYHHCATIQITPDPKKPIDAAWPKERQGS